MIAIGDCLSCFVRQASEATAFCVPDGERRGAVMRKVLEELARGDWSLTPPAMAQIIHRVIRRESGIADPYKDFKARMNRLALDMLPHLLRAADSEEDPFTARVRLAVAGNLLDASSSTAMSDADIRTAFDRVCRCECTQGAARALSDAAGRAQRILYLTDNAGEIVFDRALIEALPATKVTVGVRGSPVGDDATLADAEVSGLTAIVKVLANGSDAPGTLIEDCSPEFWKVFEASDLIVAKGQGNYESLSSAGQHSFFLMKVKCACVSGHTGIPVGALAIREQNGAEAAPRNCIMP
ncbi:MAG: ARMT1-like domain-containing protein [Kiritimatiellae bacterium]|nr:ARMT1-like domain-containing protein [Kiritimatiellia bacterium]